MAKNRFINTKFWSDNFIVELNPLDRYLFLYFLTNEHTNICGIYELPLKRMADETGIEKEMLLKMLKRLKGKVEYIDGWIYLKNFTKHQSLSEKIIIGIENGKKLVPDSILKKIYLIDKVSIPTQLLESELESKPVGQDIIHSLEGKQWNELIDLFEPLNPMFKEFYKNRTERSALDEVVKTFGFNETKNLLLVLPKIVLIPYAPKITKPTELKRDLGKIKIFLGQTKNNNKNQPNYVL